VWGTLVMIITGFMMWNPIATTNLLPGEVIPAAKVAHGGEALLAVLAIILWHFYNVHIRHFNKSMFNGKLTREEMEHEHPAELAMVEAGQDSRAPSPAVLQRRQRIFYPIAAVLAVVFSFGLFKFVTFEQTSILTMPPGETAKVFAPETPTPSPTRKPTSTPTVTPTPGAATSTSVPGGGASTVAWTGGIDQIIAAKCSACHVNAALGGLSMKTYADALKGGKDGAVIVPGDPDKSLLIQIQSKGGHPGQLSADELATVTVWIKAGAPETGGAAPAAPTPGASASPDAWTGGIDQIIGAKCSACHIQSQTAGLSLKTYADALKGGQSGPAIVPGDSDKSLLVQVQSQGGHPGQLSADELAQIIAWIKAGAPEK
jgi:Planctomycete cytochrome C